MSDLAAYATCPTLRSSKSRFASLSFLLLTATAAEGAQPVAETYLILGRPAGGKPSVSAFMYRKVGAHVSHGRDGGRRPYLYA